MGYTISMSIYCWSLFAEFRESAPKISESGGEFGGGGASLRSLPARGDARGCERRGVGWTHRRLRRSSRTHTGRMGKKTKSVNNKQSTGIDFIRAKKKVGRKIRKQANETNTEVRAKRINLSVQSLGTEGKGDQVTGRGLSMPELLNQCQHYSARVRKDALDGIKELLETHPTSLVPCAATCVEKVAERLVDQEQIVRAAARGALRSGVLPALGPHGIAPFARRLVLHVGAALTHVAPAVRRDAPRRTRGPPRRRTLVRRRARPRRDASTPRGAPQAR